MPRRDLDANKFLAELEKDPEYQARRAALDEEHELLVQRNRQASEPVVRDLAEHGFAVEFVDDLYAQNLDYAAAIPVLLRWLPRIDNPDVKRGILRALSVPWARPAAARPLVEELRRLLRATGPEVADVRWTVANALDVVADDSVLDDLLRLLEDAHLDPDTRVMLLRALGNMQDPRAREHLVEFLQGNIEDPASLVSGLIALGRIRHTGTRPVVERYVQHHDREVRKEAQRTLKAIDGRQRPGRKA